MFGMLYVLENTRLSFAPLLQRALASPDASVTEASSFLSAQDPGLWTSFAAELESDPATADQAQVVAGAIYAFTIYIRSFERA